MTSRQVWRKSTRSLNTNSCVELSGTLTDVRDSKNVRGSVLRADVAALVSAVKSGRLDR
jgi:hypothetical protein